MTNLQQKIQAAKRRVNADAAGGWESELNHVPSDKIKKAVRDLSTKFELVSFTSEGSDDSNSYAEVGISTGKDAAVSMGTPAYKGSDLADLAAIVQRSGVEVDVIAGEDGHLVVIFMD